MLELKVIVGSTRPGRTADRVLRWLSDRTRSDGRFSVDVLDLRDWNLPMFAESQATIADPQDPTYSNPSVRQWNHAMSMGDAYLFLTPEYNHSIPGALKNALDTVFISHALRKQARRCRRLQHQPRRRRPRSGTLGTDRRRGRVGPTAQRGPDPHRVRRLRRRR